MDGLFEQATATGLAEALRLDPTLTAEPERLRRALADLAPFDERGGWLIVLGAAAGVPALLQQGRAAEACARLTDLAACRADAAAWTVAAWSRALGGEPFDDDLPQVGDELSSGELDPAVASLEHGPAEQPGLPTALCVALAPDGGPVIAAVTTQGVFVVDGIQAYGRWRRVATVRAPLSRDVALALQAAPTRVLWTGHDGVHARTLRRDGARLLLGAPGVLASPDDGQQARYPLTELGHPDGDLSVLWTSDRVNLKLTEDRAWGTETRDAPLPGPCTAGERLGGLHWCLETRQTGWLLCRTDRGRMLAAQWDTTMNEAGQWHDLEPPAALVATALAGVGEAVFAIALTPHGDLLSLDVGAAVSGRGEWHSIDRPAQVSALPPPRVLAVGARQGRPDLPGWLAISGPGGTWAMSLTRSGDILTCGGLLLAILVYGTQADTLVWLCDPAAITLVPGISPAGLSSLAAGLRLLADSVRADAARLAADGIASLPPAVLIVADGLPTDPVPALLEARSALDDAMADAAGAPADSLIPVFAAPPATDQLAVAGLRMGFYPLATDMPDALAGSIAAAFRELVTGLARALGTPVNAVAGGTRSYGQSAGR
jgi:hypothetical protein